MVMQKVSWTQERQDRLASLWARNLSAGEIAPLMGPSFTRNMVLGKSWRMGLPRRKKAKPRRVCNRQWSLKDEALLKRLWGTDKHWTEIRDLIDKNLTCRALKTKAESLGLARRRGVKRLKKAPQPTHVCVSLNPPPNERKTYLQLRPGDCRYPIGDPLNLDFAYCARKATHGSYCQAHHGFCRKGSDK